jgi:hypothetical protein
MHEIYDLDGDFKSPKQMHKDHHQEVKDKKIRPEDHEEAQLL